MYEGTVERTKGKTSPFIRDKLRISVTNRCNKKCYYCHNEGQGHEENNVADLSLEYMKGLAEFCTQNEYHINKINITGGEPLLHPELDKIIQLLFPISNSIRINTNGILFTKQNIDNLIMSGVSEFKIGIDSFWDSRGKDMKLCNMDNFLGYIKYIQKKKCKVVLNMVITKYNYQNIDKMINFCEEHGIYRLKIIELIDYNFRNKIDYEIDYKNKFIENYDKYRDICIDFKPEVDIGMDDMILKSGLCLRWCTSFCKTRACGTMYSIINAKGEIVLCTKSNDSIPVDFTKQSNYFKCNEIILNASQYICNCEDRRYLRDLSGKLISLEDGYDKKWNWEVELSKFWTEPDEIVLSLGKRWATDKKTIILDLGAGLGRNSFAFAKLGFSVLAFDSSQLAVDTIKMQVDKEDVTPLCGDMHEIQMPDKSVNYVFSYNVLSHSDSYKISFAINELHRVLKVGGEGYATFCSKHSWSWKETNFPHIDENTLIKLVPGAEFGVPHYHADMSDILFMFRRFEILDIKHTTKYNLNDNKKDSSHYIVLFRKT
ncbi:MAG: radical SAM protein [Candidatus Delongbacteria bacterium]|nr:radical SAM protein [Candidatus Delongbacteria bacterium]